MENKLCLGEWEKCPESTSRGLCRKERKCAVEIQCMKIWLESNKKQIGLYSFLHKLDVETDYEQI